VLGIIGAHFDIKSTQGGKPCQTALDYLEGVHAEGHLEGQED